MINIDSYKLIKKDGTEIMDNEVLADISKSLCPHCLDVIDCQILFRDNKVYMRKNCETHGAFEVEIYSDVADYLNAEKFNKPGSDPLHRQVSADKGCPDDCGLCDNHHQHTCVGIIEITNSCNLNCPVCFVDAKGSSMIPLEQAKGMIELYVKCEENPEVLQISGGEPTIHPDIVKIIEFATQKGIQYIHLNTNGLKLADREFAEQISLSMTGIDPDRKPTIYLQFDGFSDDIYTTLRGRPLMEIKMKALENCKELGMDVDLVPTIVKGINEHQIGPIINLALSESNIKMVNFQPSTVTGRYELEKSPDSRMTLPEILCEIESQTSGSIKKNSFINVPCPHPTCSACAYIYRKNGESIVLTELLDVDNYMDHIVNRALVDLKFTPKMKQQLISAMDTILSMSSVPGSLKNGKAICTACGLPMADIGSLVDNVTMISVHAFMDEYNFDLKRAQKCCVTQILPNGKMIPFCVYNVLYRKDLTGSFGKEWK